MYIDKHIDVDTYSKGTNTSSPLSPKGPSRTYALETLGKKGSLRNLGIWGELGQRFFYKFSPGHKGTLVN